ncbi:hypothetical protein BO71DRAFT_401127 [Aspergillus ellipticus CBS 707.79]|uniref:Uncharacterized protein n=1 Tax=Aspergillus ellipticus CBS 707.79 TaxID=1448320 RepID=A0A319D3M3_9EURO|nr:hypothetical protein BO71DRAFT_401127 [Aspergillus ellipticus CBS 707.79]
MHFHIGPEQLANSFQIDASPPISEPDIPKPSTTAHPARLQSPNRGNSTCRKNPFREDSFRGGAVLELPPGRGRDK